MRHALRTRVFALIAVLIVGAVQAPMSDLVAPPALAAIDPCTGGFSPVPGSPVPVGNSPVQPAVGDFNGDGNPDMAVTNFYSANTTIPGVTILLGNGRGGFAQASGSPIGIGGTPRSILAGRFDGDGNLDLAVGNHALGSVTILLGNGNGTFTEAGGSPIALGGHVFHMAQGDFNGDSNIDLAVPRKTGGSGLVLLLGNGAGGFSLAPGSPFTVGSDPVSAAVGNFDGDSNLDVAVVSSLSNNVTVLLGNGSGGFTPAPGSPFALGRTPYGLAAGRFNGDGLDDLAIPNVDDNNVTVLLATGGGGFSPAAGSPFAVGYGPLFVVAGDLDADNDRDLVVSNGSSINVTVLLGDGTGAFSPAPFSPVETGVYPTVPALSDVNKDGALDILVPNGGSTNVSVLLSNCIEVDLGVTVADSPDPVLPSGTLSYTITAQNLGPSRGMNVSVADTLPAGTFFVSLTAPGGWSCTTPSVGSVGKVTCRIATFPVGTATFTLVVRVDASVAAGTILTNTTTINAPTIDTVGGNNSGNTTTTVRANPGLCAPRPNVRVQTTPLGPGQVRAVVTAGQGSLSGVLRLGLPGRPLVNASVDVQGGPAGITAARDVPVSGGQVVLTVTRLGPGPVTVPFTVTDGCGEWQSFVGFGPGV